MNGNNPYAGSPDVTPAGQRTQSDSPELTPKQKRALQKGVADIAARIREYLPAEYAVGSDLSNGYDGIEATVAVHPPIGHAVSADFAPNPESLTAEDGPISEEDLEEVAKGLAAGAALQVKQVMEEQVRPTGR
jgi:hypothetical protein